ALSFLDFILFLGEKEEKVDYPLLTLAKRLVQGLFGVSLLLFTLFELELVNDALYGFMRFVVVETESSLLLSFSLPILLVNAYY
ncbi:9895_t:CDS:2, partial [Racocetra persica]